VVYARQKQGSNWVQNESVGCPPGHTTPFALGVVLQTILHSVGASYGDQMSVDKDTVEPEGPPNNSRQIFRKTDLARHLRELWAEKGYQIAETDQVGVPIADLVDHSIKRNAARDVPIVDLWIALLDECTSWFVSLYTVVYGKPSLDVPLTTFEKAIILILGKIIADSMAIRHLVLAGFDTSARTILRSVSEYMESLVAIIHQPSFADDFMKSDTPETAQAFWEQHLRGGKIRRRVTAAWLDFFKTSGDPTVAEWFANWGRSSTPMLSGLTHPSVGGGLFALIPHKARQTDENWLGLWGDKAECSVDTIYVYIQFVFPILLLGRNIPFGEQAPHIASQRTFDEADEFHRHVHIGRDILAGVILSLGTESNAPHIFPDFDMSIWDEDNAAA